MDIAAFLAKWTGSGGSERANKDIFLVELCDVLGVAHPDPATGDRERDRYVFERDVTRQGPLSATPRQGRADLYKESRFVLEAKQGSSQGAARVGTARRDTGAWFSAMVSARGQAMGYVEGLAKAPPS
ncbi:MAG: hypothetical protein EXR72_18325 [Myxococcales bacterium]|nr:hypothetical protein [Myxococcales bacterium]